MATENVKVLKIDTGEAQKSVKELRAELKVLKDTLLSTTKGTEEYNKALRQAADIQHTLKEQMEEVNASAMDFGQIVGNCTKAIGGMVGGFQAATAVMNLFGSENEDVIKTLKTMQQLMALTQALPAIDNGIKAFKRLGIAIKASTNALKGFSAATIATGLGAITFALGLLISNWDKVTNAMKIFIGVSSRTEESLKKINDKIQEQKDKLEELSKQYEDWETKQKVSNLNSNSKKKYDELTNAIEGATLKLTELKQAEKVAEDELTKAAKQRLKGAAWRSVKDAYEVSVTNRKAAVETLESLKAQRQAIIDTANSYKTDLTPAEKERIITLRDLNAELENWLNLQISEGSVHGAVSEAINKHNKELQKLHELEEEEVDTSREDDYRKSVESTVESLRKAFVTVQEQYQLEQSALDAALNSKIISQQEYNRLSEQLAQEHANNQKAMAVQEAQVWMSALGNIGSIFASLADTVDRGTEEGEEKYRALMYTSTVISMLSGIGGAIASAFNPVNSYLSIFGQIAMAATTSASVLASGIAQLSQIKNANSNTSIGGGISTPSTNVVNNLIAPVQYTQDIQGASIEGAIKDSKVYVTETDITNTQNRVRVTESEATY